MAERIDAYGGDDLSNLLRDANPLSTFMSVGGFLSTKYFQDPRTYSSEKGIALPMGNIVRDFRRKGRWTNRGAAIRWGKVAQAFKGGTAHGIKAVGAAFFAKKTGLLRGVITGRSDYRAGSTVLAKARIIEQHRDDLFDSLLSSQGYKKGKLPFTKAARVQNELRIKSAKMTEFALDELSGDMLSRFATTDKAQKLGLMKNLMRNAKESGLSKNDVRLIMNNSEKTFGSLSAQLAKNKNLKLSGNWRGILSKAGTVRNIARVGKATSLIGSITLVWSLASMLAEPAGRSLIKTADRVFDGIQDQYSLETGGKLRLSYLTQGAATERQRAVQAISKAYINGRSAFGNEAYYLHS